MRLAHSEASVNGNRAEAGQGGLCGHPLAASEDELDLENRIVSTSYSAEDGGTQTITKSLLFRSEI